MREFATDVLFRPTEASLRFLPEGPYPCGDGKFSWVAIQHGVDATSGSLNVFDLSTKTNRNFALPGRPGFAFPTNRPNTFVVGLERHVNLVTVGMGVTSVICGPVDEDVTGTIINDGLVFDGGLIFGCKDVKFQEKKAGLYLWRRADRKLIRLRNDQICSNGKEVVTLNGQTTLIDIDSPTKRVVAYSLDVTGGTLGSPRTIVDVSKEDTFPDGMIVTPDGQSVIVAFYNPNDLPSGEARQFNIATGAVEAIWRTAGSPRVTCPQLIRHNGRIQLVLTTAVEHMTPDQLSKHPNAGCLFIGDTPFESLPPQPVFAVA